MKKYPKIYRVGAPETRELFTHTEDTLVIEEKVDGGNGCFYLAEDGSIHVCSHNRDLIEEQDTKTFAKQRATLLKMLEGQKINPDYYYYVEWMQKHTINYTNIPDVMGIDIRHKRQFGTEEAGLFMGRDTREQEFKRLGIENTPVVWRGTTKDLKKLEVDKMIPKSKYYDGKAEGIVIKNYCRKSDDGNHQLYAKIVADEFKENNKAVFGGVRQKNSDTSKIVEIYVTDARVRKIILKHVNEFNRPLSRELMRFVPTDTIKDILKEEYEGIFKNYSFIDFKEMKRKTAKLCLKLIEEMMTVEMTK